MASASVLPENDLSREDRPSPSITHAEFDAALDALRIRFFPLVAFHGGQLAFDTKWDSATVNAYARRSGNQWIVEMHGGLARRKEITPDGFALVVCHELGHHLGGYPFLNQNSWAASEGQADWYAVHYCAKWLWNRDAGINAGFRSSAPASIRDRCDREWHSTDEQNLCYRIAMAGKSVADLMAALEKTTVSFDSDDNTHVTTTSTAHPHAQCRLDTFEAGALCTVVPNYDLIPGARLGAARNTISAETEAAISSCMPASSWLAAPNYNRQDVPGCWFKNQLAGN